MKIAVAVCKKKGKSSTKGTTTYKQSKQTVFERGAVESCL
jgi:hypothetical protein